MVLSGMNAGVVVVLYDHRGTLSALLTQVERAISGQPVQGLGLLAPGGTEEIHLLQGEPHLSTIFIHVWTHGLPIHPLRAAHYESLSRFIVI